MVVLDEKLTSHMRRETIPALEATRGGALLVKVLRDIVGPADRPWYACPEVTLRRVVKDGESVGGQIVQVVTREVGGVDGVDAAVITVPFAYPPDMGQFTDVALMGVAEDLHPYYIAPDGRSRGDLWLRMDAKFAGWVRVRLPLGLLRRAVWAVLEKRGMLAKYLLADHREREMLGAGLLPAEARGTNCILPPFVAESDAPWWAADSL